MALDRILGIDVGGTKALGYVARPDEKGGQPVHRKHFVCSDYRSLQEVVDKLQKDSGSKFSHVCAAVAGPVTNRKVTITNLDWAEITESSIAKQLGIDDSRVKLVNDMVGQGASLDVIGENPSAVYHFPNTGFFNGDFSRTKKWSFIAPGTGLGKSDIFFDNYKVRISDSEGGHIKFGPSNPVEADLLQYLQRDVHFVSQETVLQGSALKKIYDFFLEKYPGEGQPDWLKEAFKKETPSAVVTKVAMGQYEGKYDSHCKLAYDTYCSILGSVAGDEAMRIKGGVVIGGGIFPKIKDGLQETGFMRAYSGRDLPSMVTLAGQMPVVGILNSDAGVIGATEIAKPINENRFEVVTS